MDMLKKLDATVPILFVGALVLWFLPDFGLKTYQTETLTRFLIFSIAAMGLNLTLGYAGQINLAQAAFIGVGAYTTAIMTTAGMPWLLSVGVGAILCFLIGIVLGVPALRVQHHYLAFVTLAFGTLMWLVARNEEWLTGGTAGIGQIPRPEFFGIALKNSVAFHRFVIIVTLILAIALWWIIRSPWGRAFQALRENPTRASSLGINVRNYTLLAFAIGCMYAGFAGSLYAPLTRFIDHTPFDLGKSLEILLMVIAGGSGYFFGPFLGALLSIILPELLRFSGGLYLIIYAALVMGLLIASPTGIFGLVDRIITSRRTAAASAARKAATATLDQGAKS